jgi:hypothetical protein
MAAVLTAERLKVRHQLQTTLKARECVEPLHLPLYPRHRLLPSLLLPAKDPCSGALQE